MSDTPAPLHRLARLLLILCIPPILLLSPLYLLATPAWVRYEYNKPDFPPADIYAPAERLTLADATVYYLRSGAGPDYLWDLRSPAGQEVYNPREVKHLVDVKVVMRAAFWVHGVCALLAIAAAVFLWRRPGRRSALLRALSQGSLALLFVLAAVGVLAYTSFDLFFVAFHRVFFQGESWLFAYSDSLIQLFPVQFWMDATAALVGLAVAGAILVAIVAYALSRRVRGDL
jgi:integral membrane protein (TIGR01906 family)